MPDVTANIPFESHNNARDHLRVRANGILPTGLIRFGRQHGAGISNPPGPEVKRLVEATPIEELEADQMQVDRMRVLSGIDQFPDFDRIDYRALRHRHIPM